MKTKVRRLGIEAVLTVAIITFCSFFTVPTHAESINPAGMEKRIISVTGEGEITVEPDIAYINFGVQTRGNNASEAQSANAQAFAKIEKVLYNVYKLDKKDVKTSDFQVQPEYTYPDKELPKISGYTANHSVRVTYHNIAKLGELLDSLSKAGVNRVNSIQFSTEKGQEYEIQAMEKAMMNAEAKAKALAKFTGKELKGIITISQNGGSGIPVLYGDNSGFSPLMKAEAAPSTSISSGQLRITASVSVQFEF
ncbi:SIMPL domain-containing protein [Brevibacillus ginsengisoli]|uniref:SIMPL domain-containing protein n=1 Tax=Brevibacillus ginsengisoli TaxID=363854 RepID=UPI003CF457B2